MGKLMLFGFGAFVGASTLFVGLLTEKILVINNLDGSVVVHSNFGDKKDT